MELRYIILWACLIIPLCGISQEHKEFITTNSARHSLQIAEHLIGRGEYLQAEKQLKYTIRMKKNFAVAYRELGKVYLITHQYENAINTFEQSFEINGKLSRAAYFECGEALFKMGKSQEAIEFYEKYEKLKGRSYANAEKESALEMEYDQRLAERKLNLQYIAREEPVDLTAENMGEKFNTHDDDYIPTISNDGNTIIFTRRNTDNGKEDIYINQKAGDQWKKSKTLDNINTDRNEGMAKFATHSKAFYFVGCHREDTEGVCDIYEAEFKGENVGKISKLKGQLNSKNWDSQPSVSCDGRMMFFSSIRKGGFGGADIYVSYRGASGNWSTPENLGRQINTTGDEEAPFIAPDGNTLYFTSNGHPGQGEGDLYVSRRDNNLWSAPENLGPALNSTGKELGFFVDVDGKTAYFSSSKFGGFGGLDIYSIQLPPRYRPQLTAQMEGFVIDAQTREPIECTVSVEADHDKWELYTDEGGWFFTCVPGNKAYSFQIDVAGYEYYAEALYIDQKASEETTSFTIELQAKKQYIPKTVKTKVEIQREQFFFDFDSSELSEDSRVKLHKVVQMLQHDQTWKIEVVGFADQKGNAEYNKKLSERRADSIVNFLSRKGIDTNNVVHSEGRGSITQTGQKGDDFNRRVDLVLRK